MRDLQWSVVCFSGVDWDYNQQRPQWIMSAFADRGAEVLFVDNIGVRLPRLSDARRVVRRVSSWFRTSVQPRRQVRPGMRRDAPLLPLIEGPAPLRWVTRRLLVRRLRRRAGRSTPLIVWTYVPRPAIAEVAAELGADLLVYDWADDASEHVLFASPARRRTIAAWEDRMCQRADVVFVASAELLRRRGSSNPRTFVVPHGAPAPGAPRVGPSPEVARMPRPRIGYVGTVSERVDLALLEELARDRPSWSFVLVGPVRTRVDGLRSRPNVICLGSRPHDEAWATLSALDVALIPYRLSGGIAVASPVKLHEYLAHGLPVVSTDLPEVRPFAPEVRIAAGREEFLRAIEEGLDRGRRPPRPGTTWDARLAEMVVHLQRALEEKKPPPAHRHRPR